MAAMAIEHQDLLKAIDLALTARWADAHSIVQRDESAEIPCWIHAVLHKIEGDEANSRYWYRRAGKFYESYATPQAELQAIRAVLTY